jgi:hypothetical protein
MPKWSFQAYRQFYDVPRMVIATNEVGTFLFHSRFDDALDDYIDHYEVHELPPLSAEELQGTWADLPKRSLRRLANVPLRELPFKVKRRDDPNVDAEFP